MSSGCVSRVSVRRGAWDFLCRHGEVYVFLPYRRRNDSEVVEAVLYDGGKAKGRMTVECVFVSEYRHNGEASAGKLRAILPKTGYRRIQDLIGVYKIASIYKDKYDVPNICYLYKLRRVNNVQSDPIQG
jgi:hypothetical protein